MIKQTLNRVDFSEIFDFAQRYDVSWNEANDIFFCEGGPLKYKSFNEYDLDELLEYTDLIYDSISDIPDSEVSELPDAVIVWVIIGKFMVAEGITKIFIDNDG